MDNIINITNNKFADVNGIKYEISKRYIVFNPFHNCLFESDEFGNVDHWTKCKVILQINAPKS